MKFVAVSSCPTGIAHTYMAAEALEQAAAAAGHECVVETQGAAGSVPLDPAVIAAADAVIFAADLEVQGKDRFAGKPTIDVGVKKAVHDAPGVIAQAVAAASAAPAPAGARAAAPAVAAAPARQVGTGTRIRQYLMTGVSYMIPFVAAGGILIALGFLMASVAWGENGAIEVTKVDQSVLWTAFEWGNLQHWSVLLFRIGVVAFGFLVPALSAYIAYAIADRPGIVPGFVGGMLAGMVGAGFLGGIATGFLAGYLAHWLSTRTVPKGVRGVMPVVVTPLVATLITGALTILVIGPPMKGDQRRAHQLARRPGHLRPRPAGHRARPDDVLRPRWPGQQGRLRLRDDGPRERCDQQRQAGAHHGRRHGCGHGPAAGDRPGDLAASPDVLRGRA